MHVFTKLALTGLTAAVLLAGCSNPTTTTTSTTTSGTRVGTGTMVFEVVDESGAVQTTSYPITGITVYPSGEYRDIYVHYQEGGSMNYVRWEYYPTSGAEVATGTFPAGTGADQLSTIEVGRRMYPSNDGTQSNSIYERYWINSGGSSISGNTPTDTNNVIGYDGSQTLALVGSPSLTISGTHGAYTLDSSVEIDNSASVAPSPRTAGTKVTVHYTGDLFVDWYWWD